MNHQQPAGYQYQSQPLQASAQFQYTTTTTTIHSLVRLTVSIYYSYLQDNNHTLPFTSWLDYQIPYTTAIHQLISIAVSIQMNITAIRHTNYIDKLGSLMCTARSHNS